MNRAFEQFIAQGQAIAARHGLAWKMNYDCVSGKIAKDQWWDLSAAAGRTERPRQVVSNFGAPKSTHEAVQTILGRNVSTVMSETWIDFFKSIAVHDLFVNGRTPGNFTTNVAEPFRFLALCAGDSPPSHISAQIVSAAYNAALIATESGKRASTLKALISSWLDGTGIADARPLAQYCVAEARNTVALQRQERLVTTQRREVDSKRPTALRSNLSQRHYAEKLPEEDALAELLRIVFNAEPDTLPDLVRFHQARLLIATGMRVGEIITLPRDCLMIQQPEPQSANVSGPLLPLVMLKHYAEKQAKSGREIELVDAVQHVPGLLVPTVTSSVATVLKVTEPLRRMVLAQRRTGSLFPDLERDALVPWEEAYTRLSGMMRVAVEDIPEHLKVAYRKGYSITALAEIRDHQKKALVSSGASPRLRDYFRRAGMLRDSLGAEVVPTEGERLSRRSLFVRVGEMEEYARIHLPTKVSDLRLSRSATGTAGIEDRLFLYPGRALAEAKHNAIIDVERYFSVQSASRADLELQLGGVAGGRLFQRYGESDAVRSYSINPHALRHLQNTELFRLGVADTIITKRFNRRSTAQSYVYDHRTLAEHLEEMEPEKALMADAILAPNARKAHDLIRAGKIQGPVVLRFRRIQQEKGDELAFEYLNAEAGALHFTPYGFCLNSFAASPCVKHLECFNSCSHLVRTESPEEQKNLETLHQRYEIHIQRLKDRPSKAPNFAVQLAHAEERLTGVKMALAQTPGRAVFESGQDLHLAVSGAPRV